VFFSDNDYQRYLGWLGDHARHAGLRVWAYCLMPNHIHLVVVPDSREALSGTLGPLQAQHTQQVNAEQGWQGHLWQGRFYSCVMDETHLAAAVRYVERNSVRAGLVRSAPEYPWSSAAPHCGRRRDPVLSDDLPLRGAVDDWAAWLEGEDHPAVLARLRGCTVQGLPCGDAAFIERIGQRLGRPFR
jgi:putative transposase